MYSLLLSLRINNIFLNNLFLDELENDEFYWVYNEIIKFLTKNKLNPSPLLQEQYKLAPINNIKFPEFEILKKELGMTENVYSEMKKR